ncbi:MAG: hypothetical protein ACRDFB_00815, partial [Rhabdochlamydiaceae bacterium]
MSKIPSPQKDSATWRGLITALQSFITFLIGLGLTVWNVPGTPQAVSHFVITQAPGVLFSVGILSAVGTGIVSFLVNYL